MGVAKPLTLCFFLRQEFSEDEEDESEDVVPVELKEFTSDLETDRDDDLLYLLNNFLGMFTMSFMVEKLQDQKRKWGKEEEEEGRRRRRDGEIEKDRKERGRRGE